MDMILTKGFAFLTTASSILVIAAYVLSFCIRHGIPYSLSDTFYMIKHHILFTLAMWATAALAVPGIAFASALHTQWCGYVSVAGLFIVGAAPRFKEMHQRPVHEFGAAVAMFGTLLWVAFNHPETLILWAIFVIYELLHLFFRNVFGKPLFVIEMISFATFYTTMLIKISQL